MLGLVIDTNRMTISVRDDYIQSVCLLIDSTWHTHCQRFTVKEAQELKRKQGHLAEDANWVFHLLTHLYASIAYALSQNKRFLAESSPEFQTLIKSLRSGYFSAMLRTKSATSHSPSNGLLNWYINPGVSTTSPNHLPRDRVLPQKVTSHIQNLLGIPDCSCNTKNANIHYLW